MELSVIELPGPVSRVRLSGRMDAAGAEAVGTRFTAAVAGTAQPAVVDLGGVDFIASMGIRLLIATARGLHGKGHRMVVFGAQPLVREVLDGMAIEQIVPVVDTEAEALRHLKA